MYLVLQSGRLNHLKRSSIDFNKSISPLAVSNSSGCFLLIVKKHRSTNASPEIRNNISYLLLHNLNYIGHYKEVSLQDTDNMNFLTNYIMVVFNLGSYWKTLFKTFSAIQS